MNAEKTGKANNIKVFGSKQTKMTKQGSQKSANTTYA